MSRGLMWSEEETTKLTDSIVELKTEHMEDKFLAQLIQNRMPSRSVISIQHKIMKYNKGEELYTQ